MLYSSANIRQAMFDGRIAIGPLGAKAMQPASVDVRLSDHDPLMFGVRDGENTEIRPWEDHEADLVPLERRDDGTWLLPPGGFALASTHERVALDGSVAARIEGKSSLARLGLVVHTTAGFIDPGFHGWVTLELLNVSGRPMALAPGMPVAQVAFFEVLTAAQFDYSVDGRYADQEAQPVPSRYYQGRSLPFAV